MSTLDSMLASELDAGTAGEEETVGLFSVELVEERLLEVLVDERNAGLTPVAGGGRGETQSWRYGSRYPLNK